MKMLRKTIDCENSQDSNFKDSLSRIYFCKVASLLRANCKSIMNRLHHRFFSKNVPKASSLRKNILKKFVV